MNFSRIARVAAMTVLASASAFGLWHTTVGASEEPVVIPAPAIDMPASGTEAKAIFAGGCFWGVQGVFQHVKGVKNAVSGYSGGSADTAHYDMIGSGQTGHAEAVEVTYDPSVVSYGQLLHVLFSVTMNPTQLNFQGPDYGTQYRNAIFVQSTEEQKVAEAYIAQLDAAKVWDAPIVTTLEPLEAFYPAEQYHQDYLTLNPTQPYIAINDIPKVAALQELFPAVWLEQPVLVGSL
jgi:peptide-methionine (S)-S-oxide reductase